ncbi:putative protein OS=Tsukamurella paurometabola (strain ATCC 8368 / DSM / CCUG 35730 /CIP 100753 / JCM 10117 / KCTC 9821 / NBRC 16120 / NCIMB 702349/ NCTC 13040) OX=521096 GN=Tpau_1412 PE=4 SV=1 [Tsukamurella paurometabola]|uniref:Uncharacterized protein n=1 Tax=Tsukamurella paurometabola (strain ATCC 8368 / DSM 20162 / CCUG 35730 / CIP 100753 / JCM 10117 / KCTC 9821 / NBRC 16120 / NCIMB 702349 / NCTC 13040) TaxID=521096 RepID=D5UXE8_TSUPD|nr:hypothetical protein [Tsukamurella paurometabola]ADG78040.1 hypothetical protein Tpau_1412 [Tsukamurella paurometabola DSM 20162]SUP29903.1 Uncharacterised protein [Tsukamurella paurometabola]
MFTVVVIAAFVLVLAWLTHDSDGLDYRSRELHRAQDDRDTGPAGACGLLS